MSFNNLIDPIQLFNNRARNEFQIHVIGISLVNSLKWEIHIITTTNNQSSICGLFCRINTYIPHHLKPFLFYSLFHARLIFGINVYRPAFTRLKKCKKQLTVHSTTEQKPNSHHHTQLTRNRNLQRNDTQRTTNFGTNAEKNHKNLTIYQNIYATLKKVINLFQKSKNS